MDALIFAAGLGTRLGPIGQATPKALLEVGGRTMLEHVADRLVRAGATRLIINVHHHADRIADFIAKHDLGAEAVLSHEPDRPLETGGGLRHAASLFRRDRPFFLHNVDVITDADLAALAAHRRRSGALVALAVNQRASSRRLLFDARGLLGRVDEKKDVRIEVRPPEGRVSEFAFAGIHVAAPELLDLIEERGVFGILDVYLRLSAEGHCIEPYPLGDALWLEIGTAERLEAARARLGGASNAR